MRQRVWVAGVLGLALAAAASRAAVLVTGAGATFPYPIYSKWFDEFHKHFSDFQINYQSIGSGGGIRQVTEGTVDFGATDGPMTDEQLAAAKIPILHLPTVLGAVVPTFNLAGIERLRFTPEALAGIFLGKVTKWDDAAIAEANPGVKLPAIALVPMHRSDGSGTTYIFTDYLSKVSPEWQRNVGRGTSVNWPVGLGGKGNEGVAGLVKQTPNAIGYVELIYALQNKLPYGDVRNRAGQFVLASLESVTAAAAAAENMPDDFRVSITDPPAAAAYPIASFTWLLVPTRIADAEKGAAIKKFLEWMLSDGQSFAAPLNYAPLPLAVVTRERQALSKIAVGGS
ncbi:MAG: phosphate ABC transporter substrate-binding protein PstS [Deltaproteobacteria bacterium]|nr:MAG: phosphate ABC transporter substrate-binding protein PstS [Deltaproteobacteria bacterium]